MEKTVRAGDPVRMAWCDLLGLYGHFCTLCLPESPSLCGGIGTGCRNVVNGKCKRLRLGFLQEPSAGCGVRPCSGAGVQLLHIWLKRARNKLLKNKLLEINCYKSCSEDEGKVGETLILLAGQTGESFSHYWGIHKSFLWVNSLMSNASM